MLGGMMQGRESWELKDMYAWFFLFCFGLVFLCFGTWTPTTTICMTPVLKRLCFVLWKGHQIKCFHCEGGSWSNFSDSMCGSGSPSCPPTSLHHTHTHTHTHTCTHTGPHCWHHPSQGLTCQSASDPPPPLSSACLFFVLFWDQSGRSQLLQRLHWYVENIITPPPTDRIRSCTAHRQPSSSEHLFEKRNLIGASLLDPHATLQLIDPRELSRPADPDSVCCFFFSCRCTQTVTQESTHLQVQRQNPLPPRCTCEPRRKDAADQAEQPEELKR